MRVNLRAARAARAATGRGLSIVELLVGIAIGLFILAGATAVVTGQLTDNRALLFETQIQQDLRTAASLILRDLRRAGFWGNASNRVWLAPGAALTQNMYGEITFQEESGGRSNEIVYRISNAWQPAGVENDAVNAGDETSESFGFAHNAGAGTIVMKLGDAWQALTDPNVVRITQFDVNVRPQVLTVPCANACPGGGTACWPQQTVRDVSIVITGQSVHDVNVQRSVRGGTRLRNDTITGACP